MALINKRFGELLSEGIFSVAKRQGTTSAAVEKEIAAALGYTYHTVKYWRRGHVPGQEPRIIEFLVIYCVTRGRVGRDWAASILAQAGYPDPVALLRELFAERPLRTDLPHVRHNLPPRYGDFLGRQADLARVLKGLASHWPIVAIEGMGGVGKTRLALEAAYHCLSYPAAISDRPFEAVVWISARDRSTPNLWPEALDALARGLDCLYITQLPLGPRKLDEVDKLLRACRTLVILDDLETVQAPDLLSWMQQTPEPSKLLITSRQAQVRGVWAVHLQGLPDPDALTLIRCHAQRLGLDKIEAAGDEALLPLAQVTQGNPKVIEMALGYVKRGALSWNEVVEHIRAAGPTVGEIFDDLFKRTWETLDQAGRHALMATTCFVNTISKNALGAAAGLSEHSLDAALEQLIELSLLEVREESASGERRYTLHPLARAFAASQLRAAPQWEQEARARWLKWWIEFAQRYGGEDWNNWMDFQMFARERQNVLNAAQWCYQANDLAALWALADRSKAFLNVTSYWSEREMLMRWVEELARRRQDERILATALREIAWTLYLGNHLGEARAMLQEALSLAQKLRDDGLAAWTMSGRAYVDEYDKDYAAAEQQLKEAEALWGALPPGQVKDRLFVQIRYQQGRVAYDQGQLARARECLMEAIVKGEAAHYDRAIAYPAHYLGEVARCEGQLDQARRWLDRAWQIIQPWNDRRLEARLQLSEARLAAASGERQKARPLAESALRQLLGLNMHKEAQDAQAWLAALEAY